MISNTIWCHWLAILCQIYQQVINNDGLSIQRDSLGQKTSNMVYIMYMGVLNQLF